ncbi:MAG: hypothetical protein GY722_27745 [bacterium]|nr:hypothetical protein [bacterium]
MAISSSRVITLAMILLSCGDVGRRAERQSYISREAAIAIAEAEAKKALPADEFESLAAPRDAEWLVVLCPAPCDSSKEGAEYHIDFFSGSVSFQRIRNHGEPSLMKISREQAIEIAKADAAPVLGNFESYHILAAARNGEWIVVFSLVNRQLTGGGAEYLVDWSSGEIKERKHYL